MDSGTGFSQAAWEKVSARNLRHSMLGRPLRSSRWIDPSVAGAAMYPGWPLTVTQMEQYDREAVAYLPEVVVRGMEDPVVQVLDEGTGTALYTVRIQGDRFRPRVFSVGGSYTLVIGEPGTERLRTIEGVLPVDEEPSRLEVDLR